MHCCLCFTPPVTLCICRRQNSDADLNVTEAVQRTEPPSAEWGRTTVDVCVCVCVSVCMCVMSIQKNPLLRADCLSGATAWREYRLMDIWSYITAWPDKSSQIIINVLQLVENISLEIYQIKNIIFVAGYCCWCKGLHSCITNPPIGLSSIIIELLWLLWFS